MTLTFRQPERKSCSESSGLCNVSRYYTNSGRRSVKGGRHDTRPMCHSLDCTAWVIITIGHPSKYLPNPTWTNGNRYALYYHMRSRPRIQTLKSCGIMIETRWTRGTDMIRMRSPSSNAKTISTSAKNNFCKTRQTVKHFTLYKKDRKAVEHKQTAGLGCSKVDSAITIQRINSSKTN